MFRMILDQNCVIVQSARKLIIKSGGADPTTFIKHSKSEMGSPIVCVLKGKDGKDGIRIEIDYRYLNKYCVGDAHPLPDIPDLIQRVGKSRYITLCYVKSAYHQIAVRPGHQWLMSFVWDGGLYKYTRAPFGQKGSGNTLSELSSKFCIL